MLCTVLNESDSQLGYGYFCDIYYGGSSAIAGLTAEAYPPNKLRLEAFNFHVCHDLMT